MSEEKFTRCTIEMLAKRAGSICSNPDCNALTSGPAEDDARAINVGEAAHIYGARSGAARFRESMSDQERSDITNGIWLCRNCHKTVDADPSQFSADLLFEWRRSHQFMMAERLGKAGALLRQKVTERRLALFEDGGYLAQQIVVDRPRAWEFKLTAELLRQFLKPIRLRWHALSNGQYALPSKAISIPEFIPWMVANLQTITGQFRAIVALSDEQLKQAWGPPGTPGDEEEIYRVCKLIAEACSRILEWEETVRFVRVPPCFQEVQTLFHGIAGPLIESVFGLPIWMAEILSSEDAAGHHIFRLDIELPEGWNQKVDAALSRAVKELN